MKRCPICGAHAIETAGTCFQCLYHFDTLSTEDVHELATPVTQQTTVLHIRDAESGSSGSTASAPVAVLERPVSASMSAQRPLSSPSPVLIPAPSEARCFSAELRFGTAAPHTITTRKGSLYIGRAIFNDLVIDEEFIIRRHAHFYRLEQGVFMELLDQSATATINGQLAHHISLICDGDVIGIGPCDVIIHC